MYQQVYKAQCKYEKIKRELFGIKAKFSSKMCLSSSYLALHVSRPDYALPDHRYKLCKGVVPFAKC